MLQAIQIQPRPVPWNKGKVIGQKPPLKLKESGRSESDYNWRAVSETSYCSTSPSIASFAAVIS